MGLFLQILGAIFLAILLGAVFVGLFIRYRVRKFLKVLKDAAEGLAAGVTPPRITLRSLAAPSWEDEGAVTEVAGPLPGLGFEPVGFYQVVEIDGLNLVGWLNARDKVYAVVYEHPRAGAWVDFVTRYEDGTAATYANTAEGQGVEQRPGVVVERFPGLGTLELYRKFLAGRPRGPMKTPTVEGFPDEFEQAYADEMDWRNSRGGTTLAEIRAIAMANGDEYDEETLLATREAARGQALMGLDATLREQFLATTKLSAAEWEQLRDRVIVVHDQMTLEDLDEVVTDFVDDEDLDWTTDGPTRHVFDEFNKALPGPLRFQKLGQVAGPVEADVYAAPGSDD